MRRWSTFARLLTLLLAGILSSSCQTEVLNNWTPPTSQYEGALITGVFEPLSKPGILSTYQWGGDTLQTTATISDDSATVRQIFSLFAIGTTLDSGGLSPLRSVDTLLLTLYAPLNSFVPGRFNFDPGTYFDFDVSYYHGGRIYRSVKTGSGYSKVVYLSSTMIQGSYDLVKVVNQVDTFVLDGTFIVRYRRM